MTLPLILYAFGAGMLASVNPCGFAVLPAYLSYFLATESMPLVGRDITSGHAGVTAATGVQLGRAVLVASALTFGFIVLFIGAGAGLSAGATALVRTTPIFGLVVGAALVIIGILLLAWLRISVPGLSLGVARRRSLWGAFLFGMAYALASLGCTLPIFLVVVGGSFIRGGLLIAVSEFLSYALGMGVVVAAATVSIALFEGSIIRYLRHAARFVERAGAVLLIAAGGYLIYYWLSSGTIFSRPF